MARVQERTAEHKQEREIEDSERKKLERENISAIRTGTLDMDTVSEANSYYGNSAVSIVLNARFLTRPDI